MNKSFLTVAFFLVLGLSMHTSHAQCVNKWRVGAGIGQYAAVIGFPSFHPIHAGVQVQASYQYNQHARHQFRQSFHLGGFYHRYFQTAVQLYTESQYEWHLKNGLSITPLALGGGYTASFSDMTTLKWNGTSYEEVKLPMRNNFMISLGPGVAYELPWKVAQRPLSISLAYRLQIQGIIIQSAVPVVAYSSLQLGASVPLAITKAE